MFQSVTDYWDGLRTVLVQVVAIATFILGLFSIYKTATGSTLTIMPVAMPEEITLLGVGPELLAARIRVELTELIRKAERKTELQSSVSPVARMEIASAPQERVSIKIPQSEVSLDAVAQAIRDILPIGNDWTATASISKLPDASYEFDVILQGRGDMRAVRTRISFRDLSGLPDATKRIARTILDYVAPRTAAAALVQSDPEAVLRRACSIHATDLGNPDELYWSHTLVAVALLELGNRGEAIRHARAALKLNNRSAAAHHNLGVALSRARQFPEAIKEYRKAIAYDPRYRDAYFGLGTVYLNDSIRRYRLALRQYRYALQIDPDSAKVYYAIGLTFLKRVRDGHDKSREFEVSLAHRNFTRSSALDPRYAAPRFALGYIFQNHYRNAVFAERYYRDTLDTDADFYIAHDNLGDMYRDAGNKRGAMSEYLKAANIDPDSSSAKIALKLFEADGEDRQANRLILKLGKLTQQRKLASKLSCENI